MDISIEDMKICIQEWFAQAISYEEIFEIHHVVLSEAIKQAIYMVHALADEKKDD